MSARSSIAVAARLDLGRLRIHQMDGLPGHDGRDRMLIYELRVTVPTQQHTKVVEPAHDPLELHTVDQKDCEWGLVLSHVVQERILKVLRLLIQKTPNFPLMNCLRLFSRVTPFEMKACISASPVGFAMSSAYVFIIGSARLIIFSMV